MANARKRKNFIHYLHSDQGLATTQEERHSATYNHFLLHTGTYFPRHCTLNLSELGWQPRNLQYLDHHFSEEEVRKVIKEAPKEKSPRVHWSVLQCLLGYN
jgi:hypothetical protein